MTLPTDIQQLYTIIYILSVIIGVETILIAIFLIKRFVRKIKYKIRSGFWSLIFNHK